MPPQQPTQQRDRNLLPPPGRETQKQDGARTDAAQVPELHLTRVCSTDQVHFSIPKCTFYTLRILMAVDRWTPKVDVPLQEVLVDRLAKAAPNSRCFRKHPGASREDSRIFASPDPKRQVAWEIEDSFYPGDGSWVGIEQKMMIPNRSG